jgi:sarcosine/dimethylglycine N-methyltransferase
MIQATMEEVQSKNREIYSQTAGAVWQLAVYDGLHEGWEFLNLGGRQMLDRIARSAGLTPGKRVLELCAGQAAPARYLARHYGCHVTAVEMNPGQVSAARARIAELDSRTAGLIELIEGDVLEYAPGSLNDLVFCMDSAMLIPDPRRLLGVAHNALLPGGTLELITIGAGAAVDDRIRSFAWDVDGMVSLLGMDEWIRLLESAGFTAVEGEDITPLAVEASRRLDVSLAENCDAITRTEGIETWQGWMNVGSVYLGAFMSNSLSYLRLRAARVYLKNKDGNRREEAKSAIRL